MSALPPKADIADRQLNFRFVPISEVELGVWALNQPQ